jgi:hypothetical protein
VKNLLQIIHLFPPNLACFAPWRESIPCVRIFQIPESLRQPRKLSDSNTKSTKEENIFFKIRYPLHYPIFVFFATFVVLKSFVEWTMFNGE